MGLMPRWQGMMPTWSSGEDTMLRSGSPLSLDEWQRMIQFTYQGQTYTANGSWTMPNQPVEQIAASFAGYVQAAYRRNGVVAACMLARESLFSEARFQFRRFEGGRPGQLFGDTALRVVERPWTKGTTSDLLGRMEQDSTLAGNFYARRVGDKLFRMKPDWTALVLGSETDPEEPGWALDAEIIGYIYFPGGERSGRDPVGMLAQEVCHYAPRRDPEHRYLGMSLLTSVLREIQADEAAMTHKQRYFEGGATPNKAVTLPIPDPVKFRAAAEEIKNRAGVTSQWLVMQPGAEFSDIGNSLQEADFKAIQGAGETRIAAAMGVPPVVVGLSEGLQGSSLNAGNFTASMRRFADLTMRPLWRDAASSLEEIVETPAGAHLWYDDRDIPALKDDIVNRAEVWTKNAAAANQLVSAGYDPDSIRDAIGADDWNLLQHTGLTSVQLQPPGENGDAPEDDGEDVPVAERARRILEGAKR